MNFSTLIFTRLDPAFQMTQTIRNETSRSGQRTSLVRSHSTSCYQMSTADSQGIPSWIETFPEKCRGWCESNWRQFLRAGQWNWTRRVERVEWQSFQSYAARLDIDKRFDMLEEDRRHEQQQQANSIGRYSIDRDEYHRMNRFLSNLEKSCC